MTPSFTLEEAARAVAGRLHDGASQGTAHTALGSTRFASVSTDSRKPLEGALFVALRGERFDGHDYVAQAVQQGLCAALVDEAGHRALPHGVPQLVVADTLVALGELARMWRSRHPKPLVAITGSNGKTTTKELLAVALATRGPVHKTPGNLNNLVGLPLTMFAWPEAAWTAVLEMGMNAPGEIARLAHIASPDVGLITCVAAAHLQGLGTLERVAQAKVELLAGLPPGATAILNGDDPYLMAAAAPQVRHRPCRKFGTGADAHVRLTGARHTRRGEALGLTVALTVNGRALEATLPLVGQHNGMNAAAAVAAAMALGLDPGDALHAMTAVRVPGSRGRVLHEAHRDVWIIDDCYNANPQSMAAALATLHDLAEGAPTLAVLGDMLELGDTAVQAHRALGHIARQAGVAALFAFGHHAQETVAGAGGHGQGFAATQLDALVDAVSAQAQAGTWILVKGSRGMRLERLVEQLMAPSSQPP